MRSAAPSAERERPETGQPTPATEDVAAEPELAVAVTVTESD